MAKGTRSVLCAAVLLSLCVIMSAAFVGQPPAPPEGFVPASSLPGQEQLPAAPLVIAAYSIVWALVCIYVWSVWRRIQRVERDLAEARRRIPESERR